MTRATHAPSAGSTEGSGNGRSLFRRAFATRSACSDSKGSGARSGGRTQGLLSLLALAICALALTATPASAAPPSASVDSITNVTETSAHVSATIVSGEQLYWRIDYSTNGVNWTENAIAGGPIPGGKTLGGDITGLAPNTKYFVRLVFLALDSGRFFYSDTPKFTTLATPGLASPTVSSVADAANVSVVTAKASGQIERPAGANPGLNTRCNFEYVTDAQFTVDDFQDAALMPCDPPNPLTAPGPAPATATLTGLKAGTTYHLRLAAENSGGTDTKDAASTFTTDPAPEPALSLDAASAITFTKAHLSGTINPEGGSVDATLGPLPILWRMQISRDPLSEGWFDAPSGELAATEPEGGGPIPSLSTSPLAIETNLEGLQNNTEYKFRLLVSYANRDAIPQEGSFTTLPIVPPVVLTADDATGVTNSTAELSGSIELPVGSDPASCHIEYMTAAAYAPRSEKQSVNVTATGGTFTLSFVNPGGSPAQTTAPIAYNATAATVRTALEALANIDPGALSVTGGPGGPTGAFPYVITFGGAMANRNLKQISADDSALTGPVIEGAEVKSAGATTTTEGHPEGFETASVIPCKPDSVTDPGPTPVEAKLTDLHPNTTYHFQIVAANAGGSDSIEPSTFKTKAVPNAQTLGLSAIHPTSATPGARVNPQNSPVTYQFEWGTTSSYGNVSPASPQLLPFEDESFHLVSLPLTDLAPASTYHYRIVVVNTQTSEKVTGADSTFKTLPTPVPPGECPNKTSRVGLSAALPDCRAYEWISPGSNGTQIMNAWGTRADGNAIEFQTTDAVEDSEVNETLFNRNVAIRGPEGWHAKSLFPPLPTRVENLGATGLGCVSDDFTESVAISPQPVAGPGTTSGFNMFLHRSDGSWVTMTKTSAPHVYANLVPCVATPDFKHIFILVASKQVPEDTFPYSSGLYNLYEWFDGDLELALILPNGQPAPQGGNLAGLSDDGSEFLFRASGDNGLYLRSNGQTVDVSTTQRTIKDPNLPADAVPVTIASNRDKAPLQATGMPGDGSKVLFTSRSELTNDAYTGRTEAGVSNDAGRDLYSYDVATKKLTDLTVDNNPADAATGAYVQNNVYGSPMVHASADTSYVYFVAYGDLAPGATSGEGNLYVEHNGQIDFIASAKTEEYGFSPLESVYVTPDGRHAVIASKVSLTGYDNDGKVMIYKYTYGGGLECASCRPSGEPPTSGAGFEYSFAPRPMTNDGARVLFESSDAILPEATNGLTNVYEYEGGEVHLLTPGNSEEEVRLLGMSATGDDIFLASYSNLATGPGNESALYDARVNADIVKEIPPECEGEGCRGEKTAPPQLLSPGTPRFEASGKVSVSEPKGVKASKIQLRVIVPEGGEVKVSGRGVKALKKQATKPGSVTLTIVLTSAADKKRLKKGVFKTKAEVLFTPAAGDASREEVSLKFEARATKKGGK